MAQTAALVNAPKFVLRGRGVTYAEVAKGIRLSDASVKRIFAARSFTLEQLDQVCSFIGMEISDLAKMVAQDAARGRRCVAFAGKTRTTVSVRLRVARAVPSVR